MKQSSKIFYYFSNREDGNLAFHVQEKKEHVTRRHKHLAEKLNYNYKELVHMRQIHSDKVVYVDENFNFYNPPECDALITDKKMLPLMVMVADCSAVLFYDKEREIIAVAHAGRAGAFANIIQNVIDTMHTQFHSQAKNISVEIGAAICQNCYEVGRDLYEKAQALSFTYACEKKDMKYYLNIRKILHQQLINSGVLEENIVISKECNSCNTQKYYSYRAEGLTGRFAGVIMLK